MIVLLLSKLRYLFFWVYLWIRKNILQTFWKIWNSLNTVTIKLSKVFEIDLHKPILKYVKNLSTEQQHEIVKGRSATTNPLCLTLFRSSLQVDVIYILQSKFIVAYYLINDWNGCCNVIYIWIAMQSDVKYYRVRININSNTILW